MSLAADHIVLLGLMGTGKTTVGRLLAARLQRQLRDSDELLEARHGRTAAEIADDVGADGLHRLEAEVLLDALASPTPCVIAAAASTIEDQRCRDALAGAFGVWLRADASALATRVRQQAHRPLEDNVEQQLATQAARRDPLFARAADLIVDVDDSPPEETADSVVRRLSDAK